MGRHTIDAFGARHAIDYFGEQASGPPVGAVKALVEMQDGSVIEVDLP